MLEVIIHLSDFFVHLDLDLSKVLCFVVVLLLDLLTRINHNTGSSLKSQGNGATLLDFDGATLVDLDVLNLV